MTSKQWITYVIYVCHIITNKDWLVTVWKLNKKLLRSVKRHYWYWLSCQNFQANLCTPSLTLVRFENFNKNVKFRFTTEKMFLFAKSFVKRWMYFLKKSPRVFKVQLLSLQVMIKNSSYFDNHFCLFHSFHDNFWIAASKAIIRKGQSFLVTFVSFPFTT